MKKIAMPNIVGTVFLVAILSISGCTENIRDDSTDTIAEKVKHLSTPDNHGLTWFAPVLYMSHYRTLFYGYDTLSYRLAAPEFPETMSKDGFRLLIDANYGGNLRHYDFAKLADKSSRIINHQQHLAERCQIFNNLISSCLYRARFNLSLSQSDIESARTTGLQLLLASASQQYEQIDLPADYIQGFLKAIDYRRAENRRNEAITR